MKYTLGENICVQCTEVQNYLIQYLSVNFLIQSKTSVMGWVGLVDRLRGWVDGLGGCLGGR